MEIMWNKNPLNFIQNVCITRELFLGENKSCNYVYSFGFFYSI